LPEIGFAGKRTAASGQLLSCVTQRLFVYCKVQIRGPIGGAAVVRKNDQAMTLRRTGQSVAVSEACAKI